MMIAGCGMAMSPAQAKFEQRRNDVEMMDKVIKTININLGRGKRFIDKPRVNENVLNSVKLNYEKVGWIIKEETEDYWTFEEIGK